MPEFGQSEQPQPQEDFPTFFFLRIFATMAITIAARITNTIIVPRFSAIKLSIKKPPVIITIYLTDTFASSLVLSLYGLTSI